MPPYLYHDRSKKPDRLLTRRKMMKNLAFLFSVVLLFASAPVTIFAGHLQTQYISGAGPSTHIVSLFFARFSHTLAARDYEFIVPPKSTKHAGGITNSDTFLFGRTGRPLSKEERAKGKEEILLARVPIAFAIGAGAGVQELSLTQLEQVYTGHIDNWKHLGGADAPIITVGREPAEALFSELKRVAPFFRKAHFDRIFTKDHEVVKFMQTPQADYAIAFGARPNFTDLPLLMIGDNFDAGVRVGLVYDAANADHPLVRAARNFARSSAWREEVLRVSLLPAD